jgi:E3 ubiquitin-protein ligase RHF
MEVPGKDEEVIKKEESLETSAAAFVQGGIQEACDDACSICLDAFCDGNPSTVTNCRHEYHLQCVLEWCQRSSNCPMCWQAISLKDPASQELLAAVEQERNLRLNPPRSTTIFHHPSLGDFELQHLSMGVNDLDLEDRFMQHLAAAAAMGRTHRTARREGSRSRSAAHARPQYVVFSANPNASSNDTFSPETEAGSSPDSSVPYTSSSSGSSGGPISHDYRSFLGQSSLPNQDSAGPSEFQSFSDNWKSRLSTISTKYKDSISKNTRGWKEKLFSRSTSIADIGSEVRREVSAGIATVSRMMERLEARDTNNTNWRDLLSQPSEVNPPSPSSSSFAHQSSHDSRDDETPSNGNNSTNSVSS